MPRRLRRALLLGVVLVVVVVGVAFAVFALRGGDAPPPPTLSEATATATPAPAPPHETTTYEVGSQADTFVGYRVRETFAGLSVAQDAVGRTNDVQGELTVEGESTVTAATVTAGLQALESDEDRRDNAIRSRGLETEIAPLESRRDTTAAALEELQASHQQSVIDLEQLQRDVTSVLEANRTPTAH